MCKDFRPWKIDEAQVLPANVQDYVPKDHLCRFILALVREELDLSAIAGSYRSGLGQPPFDPRLMEVAAFRGEEKYGGFYTKDDVREVATDTCAFIALEQPLQRSVRAGTLLGGVTWDLLYNDVPTVAVLGVAIDGEPVWEQRQPIPAGGTGSPR